MTRSDPSITGAPEISLTSRMRPNSRAEVSAVMGLDSGTYDVFTVYASNGAWSVTSDLGVPAATVHTADRTEPTLVNNEVFGRDIILDYLGTTEPNLFSDNSIVTFSYGAAWEREDLSNVIAGDFSDNTNFQAILRVSPGIQLLDIYIPPLKMFLHSCIDFFKVLFREQLLEVKNESVRIKLSALLLEHC